jgi:hypothetical protein
MVYHSLGQEVNGKLDVLQRKVYLPVSDVTSDLKLIIMSWLHALVKRNNSLKSCNVDVTLKMTAWNL